jgi:hypothetical protein
VSELTDSERIWNRACFGDAPALQKADRSLAALLVLHGFAMNGGVLHAIETLDAEQFEAAKSGYRFFGFDGVANFLAEAKNAAETTDDADALERALDQGYAKFVPNDSTLAEKFEAYFRSNPADFAPL